jgi:hypothetical protein
MTHLKREGRARISPVRESPQTRVAKGPGGVLPAPAHFIEPVIKKTVSTLAFNDERSGTDQGRGAEVFRLGAPGSHPRTVYQPLAFPCRRQTSRSCLGNSAPQSVTFWVRDNVALKRGCPPVARPATFPNPSTPKTVDPPPLGNGPKSVVTSVASSESAVDETAQDQPRDDRTSPDIALWLSGASADSLCAEEWANVFHESTVASNRLRDPLYAQAR